MTYTIHEFMVDKLGLKGTELLLYALIYTFSQDSIGCYYGTNDFTAKKVGCSRVNVNDKLSRLVEAGLLTRSEGFHNGKQTIDYIAVVPEGCKESLQGCVNKVDTMCKESLQGCVNKVDTDNKLDNKINNITHPNTRAKKSTSSDKVQYAEFVMLTEAEHQKLVDRFGEEDTATLIDILDNAKGSKGYTYKSDYRAILSWCVDRLVERKSVMRRSSASAQSASASSAGPRMNNRGETPTVASMRASRESFERIQRRHSASQSDFMPAPLPLPCDDYEFEHVND